jgi:hypothetical protein
LSNIWRPAVGHQLLPICEHLHLKCSLFAFKLRVIAQNIIFDGKSVPQSSSGLQMDYVIEAHFSHLSNWLID